MPTAEIITIGTELLLGETTDTNTRFIACTLRGLGVDLYRAQTIGDNAGRITEAVREAMERAEIIITTGGLGPTVDDPTRQAIAQAVGAELEFRPELWGQIVARITRNGRTPTENQKRQAYVPIGAQIIENPVGTAPAFIVETGRNAVIALPGVPREMETLLTQTVVPYLQKRFDLHEITKVRTLHTSGIGEGVLDEHVGDLEMLTNPTVGLAAHSGVVDIRITAKAATETNADRMIEEIEQDIHDRLGMAVFGADDDTLEGTTLDALAQRGWTLACVEAGLEQEMLQRLARSSHPAYRGGNRREVPKEALLAATEAARQEYNASAALGVALFIQDEQMNVSITLLAPGTKEEHHLTYGGHPANAARWAANMALDLLRRLVLAKD